MPQRCSPLAPVLFALVLLVGPPAGLPAKEKPESRWLTDYDKARATARESGKPIFLVFRCEH
jgi:hypothetical protein